MAATKDKKSAEETRKFLARNKPPAITVSYTFSIEILRSISFAALIFLFAAGSVFSDKYVFIPGWEDLPVGERSLLPDSTDEIASDVTETLLRGATGESSGIGSIVNERLLSIFGEPHINPKESKIYELFGFLHTCSSVDYNPAKEIAAILLPLFTIPMILFLILSHQRAKLSYLNKEIPKSLYTYSKFMTPICLVFNSLVHLWFVNDPDKSYPEGMGFIGHYLPYAGFQISLGLIAINQLYYSIHLKTIPFNIPENIAKIYVYFVIVVTICCQMCTLSIVFEHPILDSAKTDADGNGTWERDAFQTLANIYVVTGLGGPFIFSIWEIFNGDTNTFTVAHQ